MLLPRSKVLKYLVMFFVFSMFAFSHDTGDYYVYERAYNLIGSDYPILYEPIFVLVCRIGRWSGLDFYHFRMILVLVELVVFDVFISRRTHYGALVWACYMLYSAMFDAITLRHFMGALPILFALQVLLDTKKKKNIILYLVLVVLAGLCHSAYWIFLVMLPFSWVKDKYKIVVSLILLICVYLTSSTGIIFRLYSLLPIREATIDKYNTGNMANLNGVIFNCFMQFIYMIPVLLIWYRNKKKGLMNPIEIGKKENQSLVVQKDLVSRALAFNLLFCLIVPFQVFAVNFSRMQRILTIWNYILMSEYMQIVPESRNKVKILMVGYAALVLFLMMVTSDTNMINVWNVHFGTNPVFDFINLNFLL